MVKKQGAQKFQKNSAQKLNELQTQVNSFQLRNIDSRLNPHLLKNILNSIQSHAYQTYYSIDKLSNVLDYFLYEGRKKFVSPKEEIEFIKNLIEINKIKISPLFDLDFKYKVDETDPVYQQNILPPLISVDLVENAFKHADLQSGDAFISIHIELRESIFLFYVSNKISHQNFPKKENSGIGYQSLESQLNILYKDRFKLERKVQNGVYIAQLKINLLNYNAEMYSAG
ncbi:MAG TPA: histidine kinase [Bacteroidia bacterium]|jgi:sensor histidine kinase YesM|nr:histidine kinase [Bacteroidia bacterium]HRG54038.1 histidine kinase [Bacteroidia bacterium]